MDWGNVSRTTTKKSHHSGGEVSIPFKHYTSYVILKVVYKLSRRCSVVISSGLDGGSLEKRGTFHGRYQSRPHSNEGQETLH